MAKRSAQRRVGGTLLVLGAATAVAFVCGVGRASAASRVDVIAPPDLVVSKLTWSTVTVTNRYAVYGSTPLNRPTATAGAFRISVLTGHSCSFPCIFVFEDSKEFFVSSLAPGASFNAPIWDMHGALVDVQVDFLGQVYERDETNNRGWFRRA
jgi:hypothetical protein